MEVPQKPSLHGLEAKWDAVWDEQGTYRFDRSTTRQDVYAIDTPPPTVSGSLHLGSAFGYIQTDAIARFQRMRGAELFYPMGWDDNGLPTERRVQNHFGVRCEPTAPYDPAEVVPAPGGEQRPVSRAKFIELCHQLTAQDEQAFEQVWRNLGLSVDWTLTYATIGDRARRVAQAGFLRNVRRGEAYSIEAPTVWDIDFRTAVAQAEIEDRDTPGVLHRVSFERVDGNEAIAIETTRPELLASCVALVAHPDDERYKPLFGSAVKTPIFGITVPVLAHRLADPQKGTGIAMICTFGDTSDIVWWRELDLPLRVVIGRDGRFQHELPAWLPGDAAVIWDGLAGRTARQVRTRIAALLRGSGALIGEPRDITHPVNHYEKGDRPLEIVTSRQWYIRNGAHDPTLAAALIERGRELAWQPEFMRARYEHWVTRLNSDWLISRQRYFGIPFPVWYRVGDDGEPLWDELVVPDEDALPVDPQSQAPAGYAESQRAQPSGFVGDPDVMDTWATSSLSPQIVGGWIDDPDLLQRVFPMDLRPQGPEIIRTWLFSTVLRSHLEHHALPWSHTLVNGWILDPDRKKMSKSKGDVTTPAPLVEQYGADGLRYWALKAAPGADTAIDMAQMKNGRRLATKILNASRFVLGVSSAQADPTNVTETLDRAMLGRLAAVVSEATTSFDAYQYQAALSKSEGFFWQFCDSYIELVKGRAYGDGDGADSAAAAASIGLSTILRLFAPFLPFVTEEVWSWWQEGSVHRASWPVAEELSELARDADPVILDAAAEVLSELHRAKTSARRSLRSEVDRLVIEDVGARVSALQAVEDDLRQAGCVADLVLREAPDRQIEIELTAPAA
ncbi:MAG: valine--tRNA ligase [Chloroflexi bacterium]|nr:valine--tRNA ligase [Chloroflexota bacterium]